MCGYCKETIGLALFPYRINKNVIETFTNRGCKLLLPSELFSRAFYVNVTSVVHSVMSFSL